MGAAATCTVVDGAISQLLGPGSARTDLYGSWAPAPWRLGEGNSSRLGAAGDPSRLNLKLPAPLTPTGADLQAVKQRNPLTPRLSSGMSANACCSAQRETRPQMITSHQW